MVKKCFVLSIVLEELQLQDVRRRLKDRLVGPDIHFLLAHVGPSHPAMDATDPGVDDLPDFVRRQRIKSEQLLIRIIYVHTDGYRPDCGRNLWEFAQMNRRIFEADPGLTPPTFLQDAGRTADGGPEVAQNPFEGWVRLLVKTGEFLVDLAKDQPTSVPEQIFF